MASFYNEISKNKIESYSLMLIVFFIILGMGYLLSYFFDSIIIAVIAGVFAIIYTLIGYYWSDKIVLKISGAIEADEKKDAHLINVVEGLAIAAGLPKPKVYIINDKAPNAFATGRDPPHSSIAVTSGLLEIMNREELEGVISHELSHIKNYDIKFMTLVAVMVGMISIIANISLRSFLWGGSGDRENKNPYLLIIGIAFIVLSPIFANLVRLAVSRKREFLADATGAMLSRYPEGLASALEKLEHVDTNVKTATDATAHLFIAAPVKKRFLTLFATHPPLEERVRRLREM